MGSYFQNAGIYLIQFIFGLYILAVMLRFLLQLVRANFYNPLSQFLVSVTNPALRPLRRIVPGLWGIDLSSVVLLWALSSLEWSVIFFILGKSPAFLGLMVYAAADLLKLAIYIFIAAMIIRIVISWINPYGPANPAMGLLVSLTEPLMRPARRLFPPMSGFDFSPLVVFLLLTLTQFLVVQPLLDLGLQWMR